MPPAAAPAGTTDAFVAAPLHYDASRNAQKAPSLQAEHIALYAKYTEAIGSIDKLSTQVQHLLSQLRKVADERDEARAELHRKNAEIAELSQKLESRPTNGLIKVRRVQSLLPFQEKIERNIR